MAMIEQLSPRLRDALTRRAVPYAGGAATLLIVLLTGLGPVSLHLTTGYGFLLIPAALGAPTMLPGLRFSPLGDQSASLVVCDDFAALVMVMIVAAVLGRHVRIYTKSSRLHRLLTGWAALVIAGFAAGFFQGLVVARLVAGGPLAYFGYPALGAVFGTAWALALGWIPGAAAVFAVGGGPVRRAVGRRTAQLREVLLDRVYAPASAFAARAAGRGAEAWRARSARAGATAAAPGTAGTAAGSGAAGGSGAAATAAGRAAELLRPVLRAARLAGSRLRDSRLLSADTWRAAWAAVSRRVGPGAARALREALRVAVLTGRRLRPFGAALAAFFRRLWAAAVREARTLRRIRPADLREVRSLGDLRALRRDRGEKHEAAPITTP